MLSTWTQLLGHDEQRRLFERSLAQGRLSHSYVLAGPSGIGKRQFARLLAKSMFCRAHADGVLDVCGECRACRGFDALSWPDYHEVCAAEGRKDIGIGQMVGEREQRGKSGLCYDLSMTPQASDMRVALIDESHRMTQETANSLLKTLEEPPGHALIIQTTHDPDALLPTIRSRSQTVRFFPLATDVVERILVDEEMLADPEQASAIAALSEGSLETARQLLDPNLRGLRETVDSEVQKLDGMNPLNLHRTVMERIDDMSSNATEQRQNAQWLLRFVADAIRLRLNALVRGDLSDRLTQKLGARRGIDVLAPMLDRTVTASRQIDGMVPVSLALESLFHDLARILRSGRAI